MDTKLFQPELICSKEERESDAKLGKFENSLALKKKKIRNNVDNVKD